MQIEKVPAEKLQAAAYNPRKALKPGDAEYEKLKRSITEFGYVEPVIWNKRTGNVVGGHQRLTVLKDIGQSEIDCVIVDLDPLREKALNVALNKIQGEWDKDKLAELLSDFPNAEINPLGDWTGGTDVDTGATNRKLGSDMADSVTGGGLHGKDLSKADVSVNIYAWLKAQQSRQPVELCCAIGDVTVDGRPYHEIVEIARDYIKRIGGFEKFAEWGLV